MGRSRHGLHENADMDVNPDAWRAWLHRLADDDRPLRIAVFGHGMLNAGWRFDRRTLSDHLLYRVSDGAIDVDTPRWRGRIDPGGLLWLPPGIEHTFTQAARPITLYHLRIAVDALSPVRGPQLMPACRQLEPYFARALAEFRSSDAVRGAAVRAALVHAFCQIQRAGTGADDGEPAMTASRRARLAELVRTRLGRGLTPATMARAIGLSHAHFTRVFKRTYGLAPRTWLMHERVRRAAHDLVQGDEAISAVAERHGFGDTFVFSRQFKLVMGCPPSAWRLEQAPPRQY
jgi:AraC-like DNA-binding protein